MASIDYIERIPNNVNLAENRRLQRALFVDDGPLDVCRAARCVLTNEQKLCHGYSTPRLRNTARVDPLSSRRSTERIVS